MTDEAQLYKFGCCSAPHCCDHQNRKPQRYGVRARRRPHQHRRRLLLNLQARHERHLPALQRRSTCIAIWRSSISATTTASVLGVNDEERAANMSRAQGKRLTYRTTGRAYWGRMNVPSNALKSALRLDVPTGISAEKHN